MQRKQKTTIRAQAEAPFHIVRACHTIGDDAEGGSHLDEASGLLDETGSVRLKVRPSSAVGCHELNEERERRMRERYKVHEEAKRSSERLDIPGVDSCVLG